jgi:hypothetical protein
MPFISENELEKALVSAVKSPATAPNFYRLLLEEDLFVMGTAEGKEDAVETFKLNPGGKLNLVTGFRNGGTFLPVFSSVLRMQEYVKQEARYLRIKGRSLLEMTRGAPVTLNPASEYGKELTAREVVMLLDGTSGRSHQPYPITGEVEYPTRLVEALSEVFAGVPGISAAWMVQATFAKEPQSPRPLVGVEFQPGDAGDWPALMQAVQAAAKKGAPNLAFDIQRIDRSRPSSLTDTLLQVPPFYQRGKDRKLN